jgi:regulator of sigma E protease
MLVTLASFIILLVILIFVHELGHFLAAKLLGVKVERFSLGFPPKIWSKTVGETEYQVCWLPLGGYVKMLGEVPGTEIPPEDLARSYSHKPGWARAIIVFAGPLFNVVFAFLALWGLAWAMGVQHVAPVVGPLPQDGPAYLAGLRPGDVITEVDGRAIAYFDEISEAVEAGGERVSLAVDRLGRPMTFELAPVVKEGLSLLGDSVSWRDAGLVPRTPPLIGQVLAGKPAEEAGLEEGDLVLAINGRPIDDWLELVELVQGPEDRRAVEIPEPPEPLVIKVQRGDETLELTAVPVAEARQELDGRSLYTYMLGVSVKPDLLVEPVGPVRALSSGAKETWSMVELTWLSLYKLVRAKISAKIMGGPIMIAEVAGRRIRDGLAEFVSLMALISVNLAIINLVPLPVLDGGQLLILGIEGIRRRPLSLKIKEYSQIVGVAALVALMVLVFYNDISRLATRLSGPPAAEVGTVDR